MQSSMQKLSIAMNGEGMKTASLGSHPWSKSTGCEKFPAFMASPDLKRLPRRLMVT